MSGVRVAGRDDLDALLALRTVMFEEMGVDDAELADPAWRLAAHGWFLDSIDAAGTRVVVAEVAGEVAACAVGEVAARIPGPGCPNGSLGLVSDVATLPDHRGRGLASACVDDLLAWFADRTDVTRIEVFATDTTAPMFARRGFAGRAFPAMSRSVPRP